MGCVLPCWFRHADGVIWCWVAGSGFGDGVAMLCGAGLRVAVADGVIWCWVAGAGLGDGVAVLCGAGLQVLGSAMEWLCSVVLGCGWLLRMA